jgi:hypothetical protein
LPRLGRVATEFGTYAKMSGMLPNLIQIGNHIPVHVPLTKKAFTEIESKLPIAACSAPDGMHKASPGPSSTCQGIKHASLPKNETDCTVYP